jgi:hypothetical protein
VLPWDLARQRREGKQSFAEAHKNRASNLGAPLDQFAYKYVRRAAMKAGEGIRAQRDADGEQRPQPPSDEALREALKAFPAQEWRDLIGGFGRQDVDALRAYLDANGEPLKRWLEQDKFYAVFGKTLE